MIRHVREEAHLPRLRADQPKAGAVPRDASWLGSPSLLALVVFERFGRSQALSRQANRSTRKGVALCLPTWPTRWVPAPWR